MININLGVSSSDKKLNVNNFNSEDLYSLYDVYIFRILMDNASNY